MVASPAQHSASAATPLSRGMVDGMIGHLSLDMVLIAGLGAGVLLSWLAGAFGRRFPVRRQGGGSGRHVRGRFESVEEPPS